MASFYDIYKNKKVLITGHTGFKGAWLTFWLKELGAEVLGYSLESPTNPSLFNTLKLKNEIHHVIGNILDEEKLLNTFKNFKPEIVFHLAAQPLVRLSYKEPKLTYETNVIGTLNVLESIRKTESVKVSVNITTDKCYENKEWIYGYRENDPMGGYDPYSSSKGCAELLISSYRNSFFNPKDYGQSHNTSISSVRAGNVIGGGDWAEDRLIPDCIKSLIKKENIYLRNPSSIRPWQHVLEPLSGYLLLGSKMLEDKTKYCEGWNFGPDDKEILSVEDVVKNAIKVWGEGSYTINPDNQIHEANFLKLDISKARFYLNWSPVYSTFESIEKTVYWYKEYYNKSNMIDFTKNQINEYMKKSLNVFKM
jgi:CDP-glucose 4,6-dehydratase